MVEDTPLFVQQSSSQFPAQASRWIPVVQIFSSVTLPSADEQTHDRTRGNRPQAAGGHEQESLHLPAASFPSDKLRSSGLKYKPCAYTQP